MITEEQKQFKRGKIEASQVAAAIGISPFQTPAELAMELLGRVRPPEGIEAMRTGNIMEPAIAKLYMDREKLEIHPWKETCVHPHFDWLIAHPDYFYKDDADIPICLIEIKNVGARHWFHWEDGVPVYVVAQCVLQSLLTGIDRVEVVAYFGGNDLEIYPLTITVKQQESLMSRVSLFWFEWIAKGMIPPVCDRDIELIKTLYPSADNELELTATASVMQDVEDYRGWKENRMDVDRMIGTLEAKIRLLMGGASKLVAPDGEVLFTYKQARKSRKTDWKAVGIEFLCHNEKLYNDAVKNFTTVKKESRQFLDKYNYDKE